MYNVLPINEFKEKNVKYITLLAQVRELFIVYLGFSLCHTF